jgi:elongation factor Ts
VKELVGTIGENMNVRRTEALAVSDGVIGSYVHGQIVPGLGKIGVLVALESKGKNSGELENLGRMLAMHVAATNPVALTLEGVPEETLAREKAILAEKNKGKPPQVLEKIIASGLKSYGKENCLLDQAFIHDPSKSVAQVLKEAEGKAGAPVALTGFVRFGLGEGIEKKDDDFAAEVAAAAGG